jgi:hypothetical protein
MLAAVVVAHAAAGQPRPEIMGISLWMSRDDAHKRLKSMGSLDKETRKRQEVWALKDPRVSHLLVGYDTNFRVRYVTAIARTGGPRIRYEEFADVKNAQRINTQGNYKFTWEVPAQREQPGYIVIAHGRDPEYLDSYSVKKM